MFCLLRGFILDFGGAGALLFQFILSKILDKKSGKFRNIPPPPPPQKKTFKEKKMPRFAFYAPSSSIWVRGGLGFVVPFYFDFWGLTL